MAKSHRGVCWEYSGDFNVEGAWISFKRILKGCCKGCRSRHFSPPGGVRRWKKILARIEKVNDE